MRIYNFRLRCIDRFSYSIYMCQINPLKVPIDFVHHKICHQHTYKAQYVNGKMHI